VRAKTELDPSYQTLGFLSEIVALDLIALQLHVKEELERIFLPESELFVGE
jgi:hypothetical protein